MVFGQFPSFPLPLAVFPKGMEMKRNIGYQEDYKQNNKCWTISDTGMNLLPGNRYVFHHLLLDIFCILCLYTWSKWWMVYALSFLTKLEVTEDYFLLLFSYIITLIWYESAIRCQNNPWNTFYGHRNNS